MRHREIEEKQFEYQKQNSTGKVGRDRDRHTDDQKCQAIRQAGRETHNQTIKQSNNQTYETYRTKNEKTKS